MDLTTAQLKQFEVAARKAAGRVSNDDQVVGEAAGHAVVQLQKHWEQVSTGSQERLNWVGVVAANYARRLGGKLHRDLPMGKAGSEPPPMHDEDDDNRVAFVIAEMHRGAGSLGSFVALKVDLESRWGLLGGEARSLLHAKYVEGLSTKAIAAERGKDESPGTIDNKLTAAKRAARLVLQDLFDALRGFEDDSSEVS